MTELAIEEESRKRIALDKNSKTVRFYLWLYDASPNNINTCKLLWAYLFAPIVLFLKYTVWIVLRPIATAIAERSAERPAKPPKTEEKSRAEQRLDAVSGKAGEWFFKWQKFLRWIGIGLVSLLGAAAVAAVLYVLFTHPAAVVGAFLFVAAICLVMWALIATIDYFDKGKGRGFIRLMSRLGHGFHDHTCADIDLVDGPSNV